MDLRSGYIRCAFTRRMWRKPPSEYMKGIMRVDECSFNIPCLNEFRISTSVVQVRAYLLRWRSHLHLFLERAHRTSSGGLQNVSRLSPPSSPSVSLDVQVWPTWDIASWVKALQWRMTKFRLYKLGLYPLLFGNCRVSWAWQVTAAFCCKLCPTCSTPDGIAQETCVHLDNSSNLHIRGSQTSTHHYTSASFT